MKLLILAILLLGSLAATTTYSTAHANPITITHVVAKDSVYVCNSNTSVAYHSSQNCRGLNRCTHKVIKVTQKEAIETYGKRACKLCN